MSRIPLTVVLLGIMILASCIPIITASSPSTLQVGISLHSCNATDAQLVNQSGAQWIRIDVDGNLGQAVANAKAQNLKVLGILGSWMFGQATTFTGDQWVQAVTNYVSNNHNVDAWEIWNEPADLRYPLMTSDAHNNLSITAQNYAWMVQTASPIIREYDPQAKIVLLGGLQLNSNRAQYGIDAQFASLLPKNLTKYGDVLSFHAYPWDSSDLPNISQYYGNALANYRTIFNLSGMTEIWVTETGAPTELSGEEGQASYLTNAFGFFNESKVGIVFWYSLHDNPWEVNNESKHFGLVRDDGATRPAYVAMQNFIIPTTTPTPTPPPTTFTPPPTPPTTNGSSTIIPKFTSQTPIELYLIVGLFVAASIILIYGVVFRRKSAHL